MAINSLALFLGPHAEGVLTAAIGECGAGMDDLRLADVRVQPNGAVRARYVADVRRKDGSRTREALVAPSGDHIPTGAAVVAGQYLGEHVEVGVWRFAQDPALPALQMAEDPTRIADLLSAHGVALARRPTIVVRAYRPTQRAVLEVSDGRSRWFLKVVRPAGVAELRVRHDLLADRLPVPPVLADTPDGILVLPEAPGTLLRDRLTSEAASTATPPPPPAELERLLDALPADLLRLPSHGSILQRVQAGARVLRICAESDPRVSAQRAAELTSETDRLVDRVLSAAPASSEPPVPVHGDLYHSQLLTDGAQVTGVLDVDTAGPGERADDWATLLGYLSVLGMSHAPSQRYCDEVFTYAGRRIDPDDLRRRTAAVVLGLATAPFRARLAEWPEHTAGRLALAREWL
ncbi:MAG: aminoglycoside phosphotransferase family protein [Actinomycetia bacterium]|nr:aminoglycoside phosphotransferase family protein [Actinomycetes bacterium]